ATPAAIAVFAAAVFLAVSTATALVSGCQPARIETYADSLSEYKYEFYSMDTIVMLTLYSDSQSGAESAAVEAEKEFKRICDLSDRFAAKNLSNPDISDVYRINNAEGAWIPVSHEVMEIMEMAVNFGYMSNGAFDIGIGAVSDLWDFQSGGRVPDDDELGKTLAVGNFKNIEIDREASAIRVKSGVVIDLGAVAKGYATDRAVDKLRKNGIRHGIVNAGGDIYALGSKPDGTAWNVGVRHPRDTNGVIEVISVIDKSVVTSGDYERYFEQGGRRYCHILDPKTGMPADKCISVTIVDDLSARADIFSTTAFVLGEEEGEKFLNEAGGVSGAMFVDSDLNVSRY
ncbi:MAG: FAD:protein FMN transferase, partial [Synergistaceae bacterium]|nr:FAD:protein FMN transferase [Synergistaceae bacterium]